MTSTADLYMNVCLFAAGFMAVVAIVIGLNLEFDFIKMFRRIKSLIKR